VEAIMDQQHIRSDIYPCDVMPSCFPERCRKAGAARDERAAITDAGVGAIEKLIVVTAVTATAAGIAAGIYLIWDVTRYF
jgi:hypothetical protein